jgi:hypothetical protein
MFCGPEYVLRLWAEGRSPEGCAMVCQTCHSADTREYTAEINIHFPGMEGLNIPTLLIFPRLLVCLSCGLAQFTIPDAERKALAERDQRGWADETAL